MKTVRPRLFCNSAISSSNWLAEIGSSPAVGSSRNRSSGSSARARARPARFFMPPDKFGGKFRRRCPAASPPWRASSRRSRPSAPGDMEVYSRNGTWMFSATVWEENSAPFLEQHAPAHFQRAHARRLRHRRCACRTLRWCLRVGWLRPMMERSSTDLPRARAADHAQHLAAIDVEIEMVVDDLGRRSR